MMARYVSATAARMNTFLREAGGRRSHRAYLALRDKLGRWPRFPMTMRDRCALKRASAKAERVAARQAIAAQL